MCFTMVNMMTACGGNNNDVDDECDGESDAFDDVVDGDRENDCMGVAMMTMITMLTMNIEMMMSECLGACPAVWRSGCFGG